MTRADAKRDGDVTRPVAAAAGTWGMAAGLAALIGAAAACGGAQQPAPSNTAPEARARRVPIEDTPADDEPEDGVTFTSSRGRMDPAAIETGIEPHKQGLGDCFMSRVSGRRWLGGHVTLHWEIQKDGTIAGVRLAESDLGAWPIEKCLLEIARSATFAKPIGGDADFSLPLDFSAKGKHAVWDEDQSLKAVGGQVAALDACAKPKGAKAPVPLPDDVTVTLYVGAGGKAQSAGFSSGTVLDDTWADCAEKAALAWRLPDPRGTVAKLAVRYRAKPQ